MLKAESLPNCIVLACCMRAVYRILFPPRASYQPAVTGTDNVYGSFIAFVGQLNWSLWFMRSCCLTESGPGFMGRRVCLDPHA